MVQEGPTYVFWCVHHGCLSRVLLVKTGKNCTSELLRYREIVVDQNAFIYYGRLWPESGHVRSKLAERLYVLVDNCRPHWSQKGVLHSIKVKESISRSQLNKEASGLSSICHKEFHTVDLRHIDRHNTVVWLAIFPYVFEITVLGQLRFSLLYHVDSALCGIANLSKMSLLFANIARGLSGRTRSTMFQCKRIALK